jgi:hypothetical protein
LTELTEATIFFATQSLFHIHKNILQHCLNILIQITLRNKHRNDQTFNRKFRDLMSSLDLLVPMEEHDYVLSDIFENSSIFPCPKGLRVGIADHHN